ncbi:HET-domain-containing protein, partial [Cucurbitaria berberidis CBS 394.84]
LPTRVLRISGNIEAPSVKLVVTGGMKGRYCALSHCWGSADKRPLMTTRANLQHHLVEILFDQLPKTFQDAVMLVRGIGIEFLWIDSLCIIQDDAQEWQSEAGNMGAIYSDAALVIAAAGSRNSTEGLLVTERPQPVVLKAPYVLDDVAKGSFNVAMLPKGDIDPEDGSLRKRAWAFQEWYLAEKTIFFMPGGITWKCNKTELSERGSHTELYFHERSSWIHLLLKYSEKSLTYPSDRLHALRGIASHIGKTRPDKYRFEYGVWEDHLFEQLLWKKENLDGEADLLHLPTWSWAS